MSNNKSNNQQILLYSALVGFARGIVGFPIDQPLEAIKTKWQAHPGLKTEFQICKEIYRNEGMYGYYTGSTTYFLRMLLKSTYRYPLMVGLPGFFKNNMPENIAQNKLVQRFLSGLSIAVIESFLLCPFERFKVLFMTQSPQNRLGYAGFTSKFENNLTKELLRGMTTLALRQSVAWIAFLEIDLLTKMAIRRVLDIKPEERIATKIMLPQSLFVAALSTITIMPFDAVKTFMQKVDPSSTHRAAISSIYKEAGFRGFLVGWRLRFLIYVEHAILTVDILERFEQWIKELERNENQ